MIPNIQKQASKQTNKTKLEKKIQSEWEQRKGLTD